MKKLVCLAVLLAAVLPAMAQRGGPIRPIVNLADSCGSSVASGAYCGGYEKTWCVNYTTDIIYACDPTTHVWDAVGSGGGGGTGGTTITVNSFSSVDTLTFNGDFGLSDLGGGEISIGVNDSVLAPNVSNATGTLAVARGGTGQASASSALLALGGASRGTNNDILALTGMTTPLSDSQGGTGINFDSVAIDNTIAVWDTAINGFRAVTIPDCPDGTGNLNFNGSVSPPTITCGVEAGGGSGYSGIKEEGGTTLTARSILNFVGDVVTATDNSGSSRTDVTILSSPTGSSTVVAVGRTLTGGAGINVDASDSAQDLSSNRSITTDSQEAAFTADGGATPLTCGALAQGKVQVMDAGPISWCDGATTSVVQYSALGDTSGNAKTGDDAASFFQGGTLEVARGGTGATSAQMGADQDVYLNVAGRVGVDTGAFKYNSTSKTLTAGTFQSSGVAQGLRIAQFGNNGVSEPTAPASGFLNLYALGTDGSEILKVRTATLGIDTVAQLAATQTFTNKTLTSPIETGKIDRNNVSVSDDDCTGEQGLWWYDDTDSAFEFCNANSGTPIAVSASGTGTITNVWQTSSGDASAIAGTTGDSLDASSADFVRIPIDKTIDAAGKIGVDTTTTLDQLQVFMGGAVRAFSPMRSAGAVLESLVSTDDNYEFFEAPENVTVIGVSCRCRGTCSTTATFTLEDRAGNAMTITGTNPTCSTTGNSTYAAVTAANTLVAGEGLAFDVTNSPTAGDTYTITVQYTVDPQ